MRCTGWSATGSGFLGWSIGILAMLVQAAALRFGSVTVIQSLRLTTLVFSLPLSTVGTRFRPKWRDFSGAGAVIAGLVVFLVLHSEVSSHTTQPDRSRIIVLLLLMALLVVVLTLVARALTGSPRAVVFALAAGIALGSGATLAYLTATDLTVRGVVTTAVDWPGYALAVATGTEMVLQQIAFASGRLPIATTAMTVVNPLVGSAIAAEGFHEALPHSPVLAGIALSAVLLVAGVAVLAHSPLLHGGPLPVTADGTAEDRLAAPGPHAPETHPGGVARARR